MSEHPYRRHDGGIGDGSNCDCWNSWIYRARTKLLAQKIVEIKGAVRAEKRGGKLTASSTVPAGRDLRTVLPHQDTGEGG